MSKIEKQKAAFNYGFPSHLIPPSQKNKKWHLQYVKAFHKEFINGNHKMFRWNLDEYERWRAYADGNQSIDQYKDRLGIKKKNGKRDQSYRNLDYSILALMPKFTKIIVNKILSSKKKIKIRAIDPYSVNQERQQRNSIIEYMANQKFLSGIQQQTGIEFEKPVEEGAPMPQNMQEVDMYLDMYPKNRHVLEMYDELDLNFEVNNFTQIERDYVLDLVKVGVGGTREYIDSNGYIKVRRIVPERLITNIVEKEDFSDLIRVGEYLPMTISDLRQLAPKGTFTEDDLAKLASNRSGRRYSTINNQQYFDKHNRYEYDHEVVTVLDAQWFSADHWAHVVTKDEKGMVHTDKKDNPFWLDKKGISDQEYADYYKQKGEDRYIIRNEIKNVYQAMWVVDTEHVFNYGLKTDMKRQMSALSDTKLDYNLYTTNFDSIMRQLMPVLDNIQVNWLQYQHHLAQSKPMGIAIEKRALGRIEVGGKGGLTLSSEDILKMYAETGSYIYNGTDLAGRPYPFKPIEELRGGISEAAQQHLNFIINDINLIRDILGINEVTDGSAPNPELTKALAQQAMATTNTVLGDFYHAHASIKLRTAQGLIMMIPDAKKRGKSKGWVEALGDNSDEYWRNNSDMSTLEFGITMEDGWSTEQLMALRKYTEASLKSAGGVLLPEDAYMVEQEMERNPERAFMILIAKRRQRTQEEEAAKMRLFKAEEEKNINSAQGAEAAKQETLALEKEMIMTKLEADKLLETHKFQLRAMELKLEKGYDLDETEKEYSLMLRNELMLQKEKNKGEAERAKYLSKSRPKAKA